MILTKRQIFLSIILSVVGLVVWIAISKTSNKVEAWDSFDYYQIGLPIMFGAAAIAGFIEPKRPWRWGIIVFILQPIALFVQSKGNPLVFLGLFFLIFFMVLAIGCAYLGKLIRRLTDK